MANGSRHRSSSHKFRAEPKRDLAKRDEKVAFDQRDGGETASCSSTEMSEMPEASVSLQARSPRYHQSPL